MTEDILSRYITDYLDLGSITASPTRKMFPAPEEDPYSKLLRANPLDVLGENSFGPEKNVDKDTVGSPVQECFRGTSVLITGGTGFVGKVLTEKLIRSVPHIQHVYLLVRAKRGKTSEERFQLLLQDKVFARMRTEVPDYASKLSVVAGDVSSAGLGLSARDRRLLSEEVHVVFHSAADVRFIEPLRRAVASNVLGTRHVLDFAKGIHKLKAFVHVSTAYSQCVRRVVEEVVPKMNLHYKEVLHLVDSKTDEELEKELPLILQGWPNTYTFSKAVCEEMVSEEGQGMPICIFRPAVVVNTYREPVRGWIDNVYGPVGLSLATGLGLLHCFRGNNELPLDTVPVDYVVNCMIVAVGRLILTGPSKELPVYNFTITGVRPMTWKSIVDCGERYKNDATFLQSVWYQSIIYTQSKAVDEVAHLFLHKLPGIVLDTLAVLVGQKPRLSKIYANIYKVKPYLAYFLTENIWVFKSDNVVGLWNSLTKEDKEQFCFDMATVDLTEHFLVSKIGVKYYYLKEPVESFPAADRKTKRLLWAHYALKTVTGLAALKLLSMAAHTLPF